MIHGFENPMPPPCLNNPDKGYTDNGGHLFVDAWHDTRAVFDRTGFNALEICSYCGLWAAAKTPNEYEETISYYAADSNSKAWAMLDALELRSLETAAQSSGNSLFEDDVLVVTTEDFSLDELEQIAQDARDYGYHVANVVLDQTASVHRMAISMT